MKERHKEWARAFGGNISMEEYLERMTRLQETGQKAKEVARHLLKK